MLNPHFSINTAGFFAGLSDFVQVIQFVFKCEDYNEWGVPAGPLYAEVAGVGTVRSLRYVTLAEAIAISRSSGIELIEN